MSRYQVGGTVILSWNFNGTIEADSEKQALSIIKDMVIAMIHDDESLYEGGDGDHIDNIPNDPQWLEMMAYSNGD